MNKVLNNLDLDNDGKHAFEAQLHMTVDACKHTSWAFDLGLAHKCSEQVFQAPAHIRRVCSGVNRSVCVCVCV